MILFSVCNSFPQLYVESVEKPVENLKYLEMVKKT